MPDYLNIYTFLKKNTTMNKKKQQQHRQGAIYTVRILFFPKSFAVQLLVDVTPRR